MSAKLTQVTTFPNAVLVVTSPIKVTNEKIHEEWKDLVLYGLLVLVLACFFGVVISGSLVRPLRRIGRDVEAVGNGELDIRVDETTGPNELRALARVINATSARLITLAGVSTRLRRRCVAPVAHAVDVTTAAPRKPSGGRGRLERERPQQRAGRDESSQPYGRLLARSRAQRVEDSRPHCGRRSRARGRTS